MIVALKPIRVENGNGELLDVCQTCFGGGVRRLSDDDYTLASGKIYRKGQPLREEELKTFRKKEWKYSSCECPDCKGAGMVRAVSCA